MKGVRLRGRIAVLVVGGVLGLGPVAAPALAEGPSDPSGCSSSYADQSYCHDDGGTEVLGETIIRTPGGGGSGGLLPKTGVELAGLLVAAAGALAAGLKLRKAAERT